MKKDLTDTLDSTLEQVRAGEAVPEVLDAHGEQAEALAPLLEAATALEALQSVEMPAPEVLLADRNQFLAEITQAQLQPVSTGLLVRLGGWIRQRFTGQRTAPTFLGKEQRSMSVVLIKAVVVFTLMFGSAGGAAVAATNSLPDSPLYAAKLAMEETRFKATTDPAEQAAYQWTLARVRVQEMVQMALAGAEPSEAMMVRLQQHLNQALHLTAGLADGEMQGNLTQAQQMIQHQEQELTQAQLQAGPHAEGPLGEALRLMQQVRQHLQDGLQDGQAFRYQHTHGGWQLGGNPECPSGDCEPVGQQAGPGGTQAGGPGGNPECPTDDCEPAGDANRYGPRPDRPGTGGPGGNPEPCDDCEPVGDQHQHGPQAQQPGPGEPGGNPECPSGDCEPVGNATQTQTQTQGGTQTQTQGGTQTQTQGGTQTQTQNQGENQEQNQNQGQEQNQNEEQNQNQEQEQEQNQNQNPGGSEPGGDNGGGSSDPGPSEPSGNDGSGGSEGGGDGGSGGSGDSGGTGGSGGSGGGN